MTDDELDALLAGLPSPGPAPDFADRVMARVAVPRPAAARLPVAVVATIAVIMIGAMVASVVWTWHHHLVLAGVGRWVTTEAVRWAMGGLRTIVGGVATSPAAALMKKLAARPYELAALSAFGSLLYISGAVALRHLMTLPGSRGLHASA